MSTYQTPTEILKWLSPTAVCIIVEGESDADDPLFYRHWFDHWAAQVQFFPQDGCEKVEDAVNELRRSLSPKRVYGIVDRDFAPAAAYPPLPPDGIVRTRQYTLENYLLNPDCWAAYFRPYTAKHPMPGWNNRDEIALTITELYRECLPLSVYNWTLRQARDQAYATFNTLPENLKTYKAHPKALINLGDVVAVLATIQAQMNTSLALGDLYQERLAALQTWSLPEWAEVVSGKYVLTLLHERFPIRYSRSDWRKYILGAYLEACLDPHPDLVTLITLILEDARR